jgi:hypothetical protein
VSIVLKGKALAIEFRYGRPTIEIKVSPGQADWDEPRRHVHRAVNIGDLPYEEITVFFLGHPDDMPQPDVSE